ncbi:hypothetical protein [Acidithiobacillus sp.]
MEEQVRFVPEDLLLHLPRLEETAIIKTLREENNNVRADIICKMCKDHLGDYVIDDGYRSPDRNHQIFADIITAIEQLEAIVYGLID